MYLVHKIFPQIFLVSLAVIHTTISYKELSDKKKITICTKIPIFYKATLTLMDTIHKLLSRRMQWVLPSTYKPIYVNVLTNTRRELYGSKLDTERGRICHPYDLR